MTSPSKPAKPPLQPRVGFLMCACGNQLWVPREIIVCPVCGRRHLVRVETTRGEK